MYHFLAQFNSLEGLAVNATCALVGNVESLSQLCISGVISSTVDEVSSIELRPVSLSENKNVVSIGVDQDNGFSIAICDADECTQRINYDIFAVLDSGKSENIGAIAIVKLLSVPVVTFIVGSPRSGTTVVGNAVQDAYKVKSHGESHISELFEQMLTTATQFVTKSAAARAKGTLTHSVSDVHMQSLLLENLRQLHRDMYGNAIVIDKTPGGPMIAALPMLLKVYPQAKVIYCKRRAIENVASRLKKFPKVSFTAHCKQWRNTHHQWNNAKNDIIKTHNRKNWFCVVEQYLLETQVEKESAKVARLIGLNSDQKQRFTGYFKHNSPQRTSKGGTMSLDGINWSEDQKSTFMTICGKEMVRQKYSLDESYFK
ncbi:sulfotransferase [Shewanella maritima]|uniref:sulfotransferase n=1 Tax=Shewanella maritima TaxID=2520507 RepID=UPI003736EF91